MKEHVAITGPVGAGKTTLARRVAHERGAVLLSSDDIREHLSHSQRRSGGRVFYEMDRRLALALARGQRVVLDSTGMSHRFRSLLRVHRMNVVHVHLLLNDAKTFETRETQRTDRQTGRLPRSAFNRSQRILFSQPPDFEIATDDLDPDAVYKLVNEYLNKDYDNMVTTEVRHPLPPFTLETAIEKVRKAEDAWNTRDPERVALAYTEDSYWRNRSEFIRGRAQIIEFLKRKWARELDYRLIKEVWTFGGNRIAVRFAYESHDDSGNWYRSYGNENWEFDERGLMRVRFASINDLPIKESERKFHWDRSSPRPADHPGLSDLGL